MIFGDSILPKKGASVSSDRINHPHSSRHPDQHHHDQDQASSVIKSWTLLGQLFALSPSLLILLIYIFLNFFPSHRRRLWQQSKRGGKLASDTKSNSHENTSGEGSTSHGRRSSIVDLLSSNRFARLLRRTHSAGCSKDVPAHALFLGNDKKKLKEAKVSVFY